MTGSDSDENTVASLGYGKSVRIPAETVGWPERVLQQWLGGNQQQHRRERLTGSGRRPENWLFAGSDSGGEHAAVLYSLIGHMPPEQCGTRKMAALRH